MIFRCPTPLYNASDYICRVLWDVEASLNDGALTLINGKTPCLRIIFDVMAMLKKKKTDWKLDLGLGALQVQWAIIYIIQNTYSLSLSLPLPLGAEIDNLVKSNQYISSEGLYTHGTCSTIYRYSGVTQVPYE